MAAIASSRWSDTFVLRETTLSLTSTRVGKTSGQLYRDVSDEYGSCGRRRLARAIRFLVDSGLVLIRIEYHDELGQYVPVYYRSRDSSQLASRKIRPNSIYDVHYTIEYALRNRVNFFHKTLRRSFSLAGWYYTSASRCAWRYRSITGCSLKEAARVFGISASSVRDVTRQRTSHA